MHVRTLLALGAVLLSCACEVPVDTGASNPDFGVVSVAIQPKTVTLVVGDSLQLSASVIMSNNRPPNSVNWTSANPSLATVSSAGVVHGRAAGGLYIRATSGSKQDSSAVTVMTPSPSPVASVTLAPNSVTVTVGGTVSLAATLKDASGNTLAGRVITWASGNTGLATVSSAGVVSTAAVGSTTITATSEGQSGSATVSVTTVPVAAVSVSPATANVQAGQTIQLTATPKDAGGNALNGRTVTWASSNVGVATVSGGVVSGVGAGSVTITATSEGQRGTAAVSVTAVPVASVSVSPATASVQAGQTVQLSATPRDASGNALSGRPITWASSNGGVATVSGTGLVTGVAAGSATITATSEGQSGTVTVSVTAVPVASVVVAPATATVQAGQTVQLSATTKDANGGTLTGRSVAWATSNALVATVSSGGVVSGVAAGSATITGTSEGQSGTATVSVTALPPPSSGTVYFNSTFEDGTLGNLSVYSGTTGSCSVTSAVARTGSRSAKCTTTGGAADEAALWYTWGNKPGEPANPALSEANGYYQKFSVMFAPGSFANVFNGGSTAQFKLLLNRSDWHYGFEGEWFMSSWGVNYGSYPPLLANNGDNCSGMHWNWPAVLQEGVWYDITTWFKRDSTTHTGHAKMWVNGVLITDTDVMPPVWGTSASPGGYSCFGSDKAVDQQQMEVGATYTLNTVGPFTVYVDDVEAANFPIGAAAAAAPANLAQRVAFGGR